MKMSNYSICYFHIGDLLPDINGIMSRKEYEEYFKEDGSMINRYKRYIKSNLGKKRAWNKLEKMVITNDFFNLDEIDKIIDWKKCPIKVL